MSFWQEKNRWEMLIKSKQAEKILFVDDLQIEKRSIGLWQYGLFILWLESKNTSIVDKKLINLCRQEKCLFIQIETYNLKEYLEKKYCHTEQLNCHPEQLNCHPEFISGSIIHWLDSNQNIKVSETSSEWQRYFKSWYYKKFITPYTAIIDLSKTEEQILADMKPKWRYNIKLAEKKEIKVMEVDKTIDNIKIFYDLMMETTSRDGFSGNNIVYYQTFLETIKESCLLIAYKDDKPVASWIFIFDKDVSIYYYWASTNDTEYRNLMAPYLLQWTALKKAKKIWSKYYDFLWIASPWDTKSSLIWVTDFKLKLTKDIIKVSESYIWVRNKFLYKLISFMRTIKWKM